MTALPDNLDIDAIRARCKTTRDGFYHVVGVHYVVREADFDALVAEVKRLREIVALDAQHERAAVVAWLRECALDPEATGAEMRLLQEHATRIERGEHRREGDTP
jgi:hypothetical protein